MTRLLLIRHASTDSGGRLCGSFDLPLSPAGRRELEALVNRRAVRAAPEALFSSTLRRAQEVAAALGHAWGLVPHSAGWANEIHCGEMEGWPIDELRRERAELWARNEAQADETFAWPGGESYAQFRARILNGLGAIAATYAGRRVAVVTHAGVVSQVIGCIRGRPACVWAPDRPHPLTATEISWENGAPRTVLAFDDRHWY